MEIRVEAHTPAPQPEDSHEHIELTIPARPEYVGVVRLAAAGIAGRMQFSFDDIEDLKIAVSEACAEAVQAGGDKVTVRFDVAADRLEIRIAHRRARIRRRTDQSALGDVLVRVLMDEVRHESSGGQQITWMIKRLQR